MLCMMMANHPDLAQEVKFALSLLNRDKYGYPLYMLKSIISSPRLRDVYLRSYPVDELAIAGDNYLAQHTMIADLQQKTYAIGMQDWEKRPGEVLPFGGFHPYDPSVIKLQIWPFDPKALSAEQFLLAVAVSFHDVEIKDEPRVSLALDELMEDWDVTTRYEYKCEA